MEQKLPAHSGDNEDISSTPSGDNGIFSDTLAPQLPLRFEGGNEAKIGVFSSALTPPLPLRFEGYNERKVGAAGTLLNRPISPHVGLGANPVSSHIGLGANPISSLSPIHTLPQLDLSGLIPQGPPAFPQNSDPTDTSPVLPPSSQSTPPSLLTSSSSAAANSHAKSRARWSGLGGHSSSTSMSAQQQSAATARLLFDLSETARGRRRSRFATPSAISAAPWSWSKERVWQRPHPMAMAVWCEGASPPASASVPIRIESPVTATLLSSAPASAEATHWGKAAKLLPSASEGSRRIESRSSASTSSSSLSRWSGAEERKIDPTSTSSSSSASGPRHERARHSMCSESVPQSSASSSSSRGTEMKQKLRSSSSAFPSRTMPTASASSSLSAMSKEHATVPTSAPSSSSADFRRIEHSPHSLSSDLVPVVSSSSSSSSTASRDNDQEGSAHLTESSSSSSPQTVPRTYGWNDVYRRLHGMYGEETSLRLRALRQTMSTMSQEEIMSDMQQRLFEAIGDAHSGSLVWKAITSASPQGRRRE